MSEVLDVDLENLWAAIMKASKTDVQVLLFSILFFFSIRKIIAY